MSAHRDAITNPLTLGCCGVGHINHSLFWKNLAPAKSEGKGNGGAIQDGPLKAAIVQNWGSVDAFIKEFNATTAAIQGSGWGWLVSTLPSSSLFLFSSLPFSSAIGRHLGP